MAAEEDLLDTPGHPYRLRDTGQGLNRVQQQRAVYASLKGKMDGAHGELHALALTTKAPD